MQKNTTEKTQNKSAGKKKAPAEKGKIQQPTTVPASGAATTKKKKHYRLNKKRFILFLLSIILVLIIAVCAYVGIVISQAPKINTDEIYNILSESSVMYDDSGKEIDKIYSNQNRTNVKYEQMPKNLINAFVALEDKTFWDHHGFNFIRILGAVKDAIFNGGNVQGTSTLTQQLARNVFLPDEMSEHSIKRKIVEAYYTVILEKNLTKEQIIEAYLNTISLGYGCNGVQAASQAYFSKDVQDLTLSQCTALAALPQAPTNYALVQLVDNTNVSTDAKNILKRTASGTYVMNDTSKERRETCLKLMKEQGYITQKQYDQTSKVTLKAMLRPNLKSETTNASYFTDYVIDQVIENLMDEKGYSYEKAWDKVYNGGLKIYSTMDAQAQNVVETEFANDSNFPYAININYDGNGNILNDHGKIIMYDYNDMFDSSGNFTLSTGEVKKNDDGSVTIFAKKRLNIYPTEVNDKKDYSLEFKDMYTFHGSRLYSISGGFINIPQEYKSQDKSGNLVISAKLFSSPSYKDFYKMNSDGTMTITKNGYSLNQEVVQPQAAMTIVDDATGEVKAMVGGRQTKGRKLYNRAISPRQPGSSIKPLAVYSAAIQQSATEAENGDVHSFTDYGIDSQGTKYWGKYLTAASVVIDQKCTMDGKVWPENSGGGYSGAQTMRTALQKSLNTCAVKIWLQVGADYSANLVKKYGITTLDTEGAVSDLNPAALALGGLTNGVSTLEMANAYTVFPNNGDRTETSCYTKVTDNDGKVILSNKKHERTRVLDKDVAWIVCNMLQSVVTNGLGQPASLSGVQAGGKTGTTSDEYDIWFDGFTSSYAASLWIGNDVNIKLSSMSNAAASLWGRIMNQIPGAKTGSYPAMPGTVIRSNGEYFVQGTQGGTVSINSLRTKKVTICTESGYLATPNCPSKKTVTYDYDEWNKIPKYYCYLHNKDADKYPISPKEKLEVPEEESTKPEDGNGTGNKGDEDKDDKQTNGGNEQNNSGDQETDTPKTPETPETPETP